jgi:hypothetical protein
MYVYELKKKRTHVLASFVFLPTHFYLDECGRPTRRRVTIYINSILLEFRIRNESLFHVFVKVNLAA